MIDEEKVILMSQLAAYEEHEGKKDISVHGYFRGDYISFQLLKSAIYATVGFALAVAMYVLYNLETFLADFYKMDFVEFLQEILSKYWLVLAIYMIVSYFVYAYRYSRAKKHIRRYQHQLRMLAQMYGNRRRR